MKNLTTAIYGKLSGSALGTGLGGRMYKGRTPNNAQYPYCVFNVANGWPEYTFSEHFENAEIDFNLFSTTSGTTEIEDLYTNLTALYDECAMTVTAQDWFYWMKRTSVQLMAEEHTTPTGTALVWHYAITYHVKTTITAG